jgi:hypothetical protein
LLTRKAPDDCPCPPRRSQVRGPRVCRPRSPVADVPSMFRWRGRVQAAPISSFPAPSFRRGISERRWRSQDHSMESTGRLPESDSLKRKSSSTRSSENGDGNSSNGPRATPSGNRRRPSGSPSCHPKSSDVSSRNCRL